MTKAEMHGVMLREPKGESRIRPLAPDKVNAYVKSEYEKTRFTWGIPNNLIRTMAWCPQLALTEVDYANSFIFDEDTYAPWPRPGAANETVLFQQAGFVDRITKELIINVVSLINRSRYSITHHTMISWSTLSTLVSGRTPEDKARRAEAMLLALVNDKGEPAFEGAEFENKPLFTAFQTLCLRLATKMNVDAHSISDEEFEALRREALIYAQERVRSNAVLKSQLDGKTDKDYFEAYANAVLIELTWCIGHFAGLLNKWFIVLKVRDESDASIYGFDFLENYNKSVPASIRARNNALLGASGWGSSN